MKIDQVINRKIIQVKKMPFFRKLGKLPAFRFTRDLLKRFSRHQVTTHAAALAYYTLLSTIPLLFFILTVGSFFVGEQELQALSLNALDALLPTTAKSITDTLTSILRYRGSLGTAAALGALWSGSGMFTVLEASVNAVWERPRNRTYWKRRLIGILALFSITIWVLLALFARTLWSLLPHWLPLMNNLGFSYPQWTEQGLALTSIFVLNLTVFQLFPAKKVSKWRALVIGLGVSVVWVISRELFAWALAAGLLHYPLFYGSLWVLVAASVWAYWSYLILLIGAELQAYLEEQDKLISEST